LTAPCLILYFDLAAVSHLECSRVIIRLVYKVSSTTSLSASIVISFSVADYPDIVLM
jgi:hypothetical protein